MDLAYRAFDPLTLAYLGRVHMESVSFQRRLPGEVGELRGQVSLASAAGYPGETPYADLLAQPNPSTAVRATLSQTLRAIRPTTLIVVDRGNSPVWWGYIASNPYDSDTGVCQILAREPWAYAQGRLLRADLDYGNNGINLKDQTSEIFKGLLDWMLSETVWSNVLWDTSGIAVSGVLRERHYVGSERHYIGELCQNLGDLVNGFEFLVDCVYSSSRSPLLRVRTGYPRLGRQYDPTLPDSIPRLSFPGSIIQYSWSEDEAAYATEVDAISRNSDGSVSIATATNQALRDQSLPERSTAVNFDNVIDVVGTLQEHAAAEARKRSSLVGLPTIRATASAVLGYISPGDDVQLSFDDWRFPVPLSLVVRVLGYDIDVDQETASIALDLTA
jgi:hypothetical protein